jgi:aminodeoxyfutalosine synthase
LPAAAGEIRLAGEAATLADAVTAARAIAGRAGAIPVSAFSLEQVARWSDAQGVPLERGLTQLKEAGLASIAGVSIDGGLDVARALEAASRAGMTVARIGFDGPGRDWLAQLWALSASADAARSVRALAPLPQGGDPAAPTTGYEDLKRVALARLLARSTDTIQVSWALYGPKLAQVALAFGADDLDDVAAADPPGTGPRRATLEEVRRNIGAAGLTPVERNGRWEPVRSTDD